MGRIQMGPTARTVAGNLRRVREGRGLSLRVLSVLVKGTGHSLSADAINKIENGIRRADSDDLVALALALNVSPLSLLLPPTAGDEPVQLTGGTTVPSHSAWNWAEGRQAIPGGDAPDDPTALYERQESYDALALPPERRRRERQPTMQSARRLYEAIEEWVKISPDADPTTGATAQRRHQQLGHDIDDLVEQMPPAPGG
ncbi:helix-turn-helix domain-containing protein [Streptomyces fagopyri]|uniref:helix-turn-helix domain-containing protein n=1 Tax=Streptomyces fagopyri TaxID=2662397 RepID=UPI00381DFE9A